MILIVMIIIIIIVAIKAFSCGGGCSGFPCPDIDDVTNTNRVLATGTNRNLWLNDIGALIAIIALLLLSHECPKNKSVVFSLPFVLWHRWGWEHFVMVIGAKASSTRHRILVGTHAGAIR